MNEKSRWEGAQNREIIDGRKYFVLLRLFKAILHLSIYNFQNVVVLKDVLVEVLAFHTDVRIDLQLCMKEFRMYMILVVPLHALHDREHCPLWHS